MRYTASRMQYWLIKSEAEMYSIDDLKRDKRTAWTGIRNYQARNFMRDEMKAGDRCLFYHSNSEPSGVYGIAEVASAAKPDLTAQDKSDEHYDPKALHENPIWMCVDMRFVKKFKKPVPLSVLRADPKLRGMLLLAPGSRLSVMPVSKVHFEHIVHGLARG
jgi:predicted RNA-binding protein with PUA-like domain